jgi:hypothetical protein
LYNAENTIMDKKADKKNRNPVGIWLKKGIKKIVSLILGESDFSPSRHRGGDLLFNPDCMEILEIDFDSSGIPRPKVFKLNLVISSFFNRVKKNLRTINALYLVLSDEMAMQFESFGQEWKDRFMQVLNEDYLLELERIHYIRESDILNLLNRDHIRERMRNRVPIFKTPYKLKTREFLIVAGGFINFKYREPPLMRETRGVISDFRSDETIASIEVSFFKLKENARMEKIQVTGEYPVKYHSNAGAYFFIGGEWYHNIFLPDLWDPQTVRYICFRIDDDGRYIRFFPDAEKRHLPVCLKKPEKDYGSGFVKLTYTINPDYLSNPDMVDFKIGIRYESPLEAEPTELIADIEEEAEMSIETLGWNKINREIEAIDGLTGKNEKIKDHEPGILDPDVFPFLLTHTVLLPRPGTRPGDISAYEMQIGDREGSIRFSASSPENKITILTSTQPNRPYKKQLGEDIDFTTILKGHSYSFSNKLISRIDDDEMKLYFSWELNSTVREKILLQADYYLVGRDPLKLPDSHVIRLNETREAFWRIGSSRNHAWIQKGVNGYDIFNISASNSIYIIKTADLDKPVIVPKKLNPVSGKKHIAGINEFLDRLKAMAEDETITLPGSIAQSHRLGNDDLIIIGNRIFLVVQPVIVQSELMGNARRFMKTIQHKKSKVW